MRSPGSTARTMQLNSTYHDLTDKSVFLTGGGSGIGAALTEGFLRQGAKVAFVQRSDAGALVDEIEARTGRRALFIACDLREPTALTAAMDEAKAQHGPIEVLVNNAARDTRHGLHEWGHEEWDQSLAINLRPHYLTVRHAAPDMRAAGRGAIVNLSSIAYMMGESGFPAYVAAKAGITGLTRGLARELGPDGIRVNALMPGWVMTERQLELWASEEAVAAHLERQCIPQKLQPVDMVEPCLFLASDASRMMTGQALVVDGGVVVTG